MTGEQALRADPVHLPERVRQLAEQLDPGLLAVLLALLPDDHALAIGCRLAVSTADARRQWRAVQQQTRVDVHGALRPEEWRRWASQHIPHAELQRRRAEPGPLAAESRAG